MVDEKDILLLIKKTKTKEKGFQLLVEEYSKRLYFQIKELIKNHEDTNDILQNTLVKAWKYIDGFKENAKLSTWLYTIAKNETLTFIKKNKKYSNSSSEKVETVFSKLKAEEYLDDELISEKLNIAIETLPKKQKEVFKLRYFKEMKYKEMALKLNLSESALKSSYHFAVKKIEDFLRED